MSVYVDSMRAKYGRMVMCHMLADTTEELLAMADTIGVSRRWIQDAGTIHEHFDIALTKRSLAVKAGAIEIDFHQVADLLEGRRVREVRASDQGALPPGVEPDIETVRSPDADTEMPLPTRRWWLSTQAMTIEIETQGKVVTKAAPIAQKFVGLQSSKLVRWMSYQPGPLRIEELT